MEERMDYAVLSMMGEDLAVAIGDATDSNLRDFRKDYPEHDILLIPVQEAVRRHMNWIAVLEGRAALRPSPAPDPL